MELGRSLPVPSASSPTSFPLAPMSPVSGMEGPEPVWREGSPLTFWTDETLLRSVQKNCGLFDTGKASSRTVASENPTSDTLDSFGALGEGGNFGELLNEFPLDITGVDFLDSFMDLSNFLPTEADTTGPLAVASDFDGEKTTVDFSKGLSDIIQAQPAQPSEQVVTSTSEMPLTFDLLEVSESVQEVTGVSDLDLVDVEEMVDDGTLDASAYTTSAVPDHDYMFREEACVAVSTSSTSEQSPAPGKAPKSSKDKYRERRDKNNIASRRSRQIRKQKYAEMDMEADQLEIRNEQLRAKIVELESLAKLMKAELIKKMTGK